MLTSTFSRHKGTKQDISNFKQQIDQCSSRLVELAAVDSEQYCKRLVTLETEYQQLQVYNTHIEMLNPLRA